jgi:hypothetical protein
MLPKIADALRTILYIADLVRWLMRTFLRTSGNLSSFFAFADDFIKLSSHMGTASLMMMGSSMHTSFALNSVTEKPLRLGGRILLARLRSPANFRRFNIIKFRATPTPDD